MPSTVNKYKQQYGSGLSCVKLQRLMENNTNSASSDRQDHAVLNVANPQADVAISVGSLQTENHSSSSSSSGGGNGSISRSTSDGGSSSSGSSNQRHRRSPLNSRLWICIEVAISVSQIIASIIVLSLSTDEKPRVPLSIWVSGYAVGCFATLPLLYRRYTQLYVTRQAQGHGHGHSNYTAGMSVAQGEESRTVFQSSRRRGNRDAALGDSRLNVFVERFKMVLDCFFAVWFVVGNVWIFGGHSSSSEAPNLYRLCIVFLTFSCIGYAMPFVLCVTICCCLPCIISLLRLQEDQIQTKGASPEVINSLQTYKFKAKDPDNRQKNKDDIDSDSESSNEGVFVSAGTGKERAVSAPDAVCSICLGKYKDGVELRELPCTHHFHIECIDKWLKINASCPLCKHEVAESIKAAQEAREAEEQRDNTNQCG